MNMEVAKKPALKLSNTVVRRSVPMTAKGCDFLRAAREHITREIEAQTGQEVSVPFPVVIHMVLGEYCKLKGIEPHGSTEQIETDGGDES